MQTVEITKEKVRKKIKKAPSPTARREEGLKKGGKKRKKDGSKLTATNELNLDRIKPTSVCQEKTPPQRRLTGIGLTYKRH